MPVISVRPVLILLALLLGAACVGVVAWMAANQPAAVGGHGQVLARGRSPGRFKLDSAGVPYLDQPRPGGPAIVWEPQPADQAADIGRTPSPIGYPPVLAGLEGVDQRFVCRGKLDDGQMRAGKTVSGKCNVAADGREVVLTQFEVLHGFGKWSAELRSDAVPVADGMTATICRTVYAPPASQPGMHAGMVDDDGRCHFGYGGAEQVSDEFEVFYASPT